MSIELNVPFSTGDIRHLKTGDAVFLSGIIYTGRDAAHLRLKEEILAGEKLSFDPAGQVLYYVGPTPPKPGHAVGSAGPTTAGRMDSVAPLLIERGLKGMIGKGRRSQAVVDAMKKHEAIYFGAVEGTAALIGRTVKSAEVIAYPDLGVEAIYRFEVQNFPVLVINDLDGGDLYLEGQAKYRSIP